MGNSKKSCGGWLDQDYQTHLKYRILDLPDIKMYDLK